MENPLPPHSTSSYITRLNRTLNVLQHSVKEQEAVLEQLRTTASLHPKSHLQQIRSLNAVYESLVAEKPYLPSPESSLPALLALRSTKNCIAETEDSMSKTELGSKKIQKRLEEEESDLTDASIIRTALATRISSLQIEIEVRQQRSPSQIAREMIRDVKKKKAFYDRETGKLVKAFNGFIDEHLAQMLAAEELGGPIVGEALDVDEEMLEAGFTSHGKARNFKNVSNEDKRQLRISEIWGSKLPENGTSKKPWNETRAAAAEMRELTEQLLNGLVESEGRGTGEYVELERESAAARFLVRSKVAQFHPKNARRLRLADFGGEVED